MNTRKQVLVMSVLLLMMLVAVAVYAAWYPNRATSAEEHFEEARAERGSIMFARNCRTCHGDVGEGGILGGRLPGAPALNRPDLQGFEASGARLASEVTPSATTIEVDDAEEFSEEDIILVGEERMRVIAVDGNTLTVQRGVRPTEAAGHFTGAQIYTFDAAVLTETITHITNTIACGRVGTAMPAWAQQHGGPLSPEQIDQLVILITTARWHLVADEVDHEDETNVLLTAPLPADATEVSVSDITRFNANDAIRIGNERLRITSLPDFPATASNLPGNLTVERAIFGTFAGEHPAGIEIYLFPEAPEPASILEQSCGQRASAPAATGPCAVDDGVVSISADQIAFNCSRIEVEAGGTTTISFTNLEAVPHNVAVYMSEEDLTPVADGAVGNVFSGPDVTEDITFDTPEPGEYFFRCDVHPVQMVGTFTVN